MILYTPLSSYDIYPTEETIENSNQHVISYEGKTLRVKQTSAYNFEVLQVISTDPSDFLKKNFQPGAVLTLKKPL